MDIKKVRNLFKKAGYIPNSVQKVIKQATKILPKVKLRLIIHQFKASKNEKICLNRLIICYMILHMQNESGCATEDRCDFPYMSYYKYLLKRELKDLLKYVKWCTPATRTKNQLNQYKIELQLHVPNAFSIISKNESHIRMASSSWHVARVIRILSIISLIFTIGFGIAGIYYHKDNNSEANRTEIKAEIRKKHIAHVVLNYNELTNSVIKTPSDSLYSDSKQTDQNNIEYKRYIDTKLPFVANTSLPNEYLAILFPILTWALAAYIRRNVPRFIHYQRLREIYYTIKIFKLWEDTKSHKEELYRQNLAIRRAEAGMPPLPSDNMPPNMNFF